MQLLSEMLDHYNGDNSGNERELLDELFSSCEKMQPKLFRYNRILVYDQESTECKKKG